MSDIHANAYHVSVVSADDSVILALLPRIWRNIQCCHTYPHLKQAVQII